MIRWATLSNYCPKIIMGLKFSSFNRELIQALLSSASETQGSLLTQYTTKSFFCYSLRFPQLASSVLMKALLALSRQLWKVISKVFFSLVSSMMAW